jgi:hypothetical protein
VGVVFTIAESLYVLVSVAAKANKEVPTPGHIIIIIIIFQGDDVCCLCDVYKYEHEAVMKTTRLLILWVDVVVVVATIHSHKNRKNRSGKFIPFVLLTVIFSVVPCISISRAGRE